MILLGGDRFSVVHVIRHRDDINHDIALLKVDRNITMQPYHVAPICLPQYNYHNTEDEYGLLAGWGSISGNASEPVIKNLQIGWVKILKSYQDGSGIWSKDMIIERTPAVNGTMICNVSMVKVGQNFLLSLVLPEYLGIFLGPLRECHIENYTGKFSPHFFSASASEARVILCQCFTHDIL